MDVIGLLASSASRSGRRRGNGTGRSSRRLFAAHVLSQETKRGKLDWRKAYDELRLEAATLPPHVADQCFALLAEIHLVFGCSDCVVTPAGEHVFLEVNEMGQFLFVERYCGLPLIDAFAEFLLQGRSEFDWREEAVTVRYSDPDFEQAALARSTELLRSHVETPESLIVGLRRCRAAGSIRSGDVKLLRGKTPREYRLRVAGRRVRFARDDASGLMLVLHIFRRGQGYR
jgi:hypothetical protein